MSVDVPSVDASSPACSVSPGVGVGFFFSSSALAFLSKTTPDSKAISSTGMGSENQSRSYPPSGFGPDARPNSPRPTNSTSLVFRTPSGSSKRSQRSVEEALPQAGERPGSGVLERRWPVAVDVARTHRLVEQSLGLQGCDDPATQRFGRAGVAGPQVDDLQAAGVRAVGQHHETVAGPYLVLGVILGVRDFGLDFLVVGPLEVRA